jgi:hypothetical protein
MTSTDIASRFPHSKLSLVSDGVTPPTYQTLAILQKQLNANAQAIRSDRGGGRLGHQALVNTPEKYLLKSNNVPFIAPVNPGPNPEHEHGATQHQINENNRQHNLRHAEWHIYCATDDALRTQIINATPHSYLRAMEHREDGFGRRTALELLTHLWTRYGKITEEMLNDNLVHMMRAWHPSAPIATLYLQLDDAQALATAGNDAISDLAWMRAGAKLILATGLFDTACREWKHKPTDDRTKELFMEHFDQAEEDYQTLGNTAGALGYQGGAQANAIIEAQQQAILDYDARLNKALAALEVAATTNKNNNSSAKRGGTGGGGSNSTKPHDSAVRSYCWTHGIVLNAKHTSATCKRKATGHVDEATLNNKMGGNTDEWKKKERSQQQEE